MSLIRRCSLVASLGSLLALSAPALAVTTLDTPSIGVIGTSPAYIAFRVTAGPSGTPAGFTIEWMTKADFDTYGWPTSYAPPSFNYCTFDGTPTYNVTPGVSSFLLSPSAAVRVVLGELFDETGLYTTYTDEMLSSTQYAVRVRAEAGPGVNASANSATQIVSSGTHEVCRFTQGYWKNHPDAWPVTSLLLGTVLYTKAQMLAILGTPANGNGLLILAHQLIAAKLNAILSTPSAGIVAAIASADALIGGLIIPPTLPGPDGFLDPSLTDGLTTTLDDFNNGLTPGDTCVTPTEPTTWGRLKTLYR